MKIEVLAMCATIMAALQILAIAPLSLRFAPCPDAPGTCSSLSISLLQSTSEHYFQAQKFVDAAYREKIRKANTPAIAARLGRARTEKLRPDWESVKVQVMRDALMAKFQQHGDLTALLLSTGAAKLIEDTSDDDYWGCGSDGRGKNMLGKILMEIRTSINI